MNTSNYSPSLINMNGHTLLSVILEHCPPWIIGESRKKWIKDAILARNLTFLQLLTRTVEPFIIDATEYLELAVGVESNYPVIQYLISLNQPFLELKILKSAVKNKSFKNLKFLQKKMGFEITDNYHLFESAAGTEDNIPIMEYLIFMNCPIDRTKTVISAAKNGALNNLKWLDGQNGFTIDNDIFHPAIDSGSLELLKWRFGNGCNIPSSTGSTGENCSIETLEWLKENGLSIAESSYLFEGAARKGNLVKMEWLLKNECPLHDFLIFAAAAEHGSLDSLKWLLGKKCPIKHWEIFEAAARHGNLENMDWLLKNKCPINHSFIFIIAAQKGNMEIMEWLLEKGCLLNDPYILAGAAINGNMEVMKWLVAKGCTTNNQSILDSAAVNGSLINMKWLLEIGCPIYHEFILKEAAINGSLRNLKWLFSIGCQMNYSQTFSRVMFSSALEYGSLRNMKWFLDNGCPITDQIRSDASKIYGSFETFTRLLENLGVAD